MWKIQKKFKKFCKKDLTKKRTCNIIETERKKEVKKNDG